MEGFQVPVLRQAFSVSGNFMTTRKLIALIILTLLLGCRNNNQIIRQNNIQRIVFATGGCYGKCPFQVIDIDSSLTVKYNGVKYTDHIGFYVSTINSNFWDTLNIKFENIKYKGLNNSYEHSIDDLSTEIYIYYNGNKVKHILGQSASLPDSVMTVYEWLLHSIKQMNFKQTDRKLTFPTHYQKPIIVDVVGSIMFLPPSKKKSYR
ncbi:DUF6438 domain-containing protein [Mucilaginibacter sp.]|uniref:DUF6438 domain-containing protein n=1 Tax=Mucilaginibacter sp. TaxID=1882438 RepID=UPI003B00656A